MGIKRPSAYLHVLWIGNSNSEAGKLIFLDFVVKNWYFQRYYVSLAETVSFGARISIKNNHSHQVHGENWELQFRDWEIDGGNKKSNNSPVCVVDWEFSILKLGN